ncbi:hypothetical protein [Dyadobacter psychrotolerans]|uniref:Uncharacterized protein n=1 Tax=Dyadobacter psychrotolerans TaxID=2541721 RepID=A0A4R5DST5_9BACT|nr:hypothetical protein [Dyadobacter psychrotolerans]TDE17556.1 hypothetical protein E0F88_06605 [Dyadobacter psychrotolerans]
MDIKDLKAEWQKAGSGSVNEETLKLMTKISQHPTLRKLRIKLISEAIFLIILLFVYYDGFDGDKKPIYVNVLLVLSILLYITNNFLGFLFIKNPVRGNNIIVSLQKLCLVLKRMTVFSLLSSTIYAATLIFYFSVSVEFTFLKYILLGTMMLIFVIISFFSYKKWKQKIDYFSHVLSAYIKDVA